MTRAMRARAGAVAARLADAAIAAALVAAGELAWVVARAGPELAGTWEISLALRKLVPLAIVVVAPLAAVGAGLLEVVGVAARAEHPRARAARAALGGAGALFGAVVGLGTSNGRHFAALGARAAFVATLALVGCVAALAAARAIGAALARAPRLVALAAAVALAAVEVANVLVLPRLYPAFHLALVALVALGAPALARAWSDDLPRALRIAIGVTLFGGSLATAPGSARRLARADNLRVVALERGPVLGRAVELAARLAPPEPLDDEPGSIASAAAASTGAPTRALDLVGRDVVVITVDALRADHVGAYGYSRPTTPRLDALAREGVVFEHAYCATPHTSYSVTSLMTGKNLRPLLLQGLGADSDTLAGLLRKYGYRTAGFYPPAVFFIDADRFEGFRERGLDFEYRKVEFAEPLERAKALEAYLARRRPDRRVLAWVHLFEPHEPYVAHPDLSFGERDVDRYDGEIRHADEGIGAIVDVVHKLRSDALLVITADHGEEFGEHGGRYHGTTVFEEQVRVPLVVVAPGKLAPRRVAEPVQAIDVLPTILAALDVPRPARVRGRDLGPLLVGASSATPAPERGAFSETDEQTLLAEGDLRLVCQRRVGACSLYDLATDPGETHDVSARDPVRFEAMRRRLRALAASHGKLESAGLRKEGKAMPDALRRALAGDADAALDAVALLDDADVGYRRIAAKALFDLARPESAAGLRLSLARDEDDEVRRWDALALTRLGDSVARSIELLASDDETWRRLAALALAEGGDARGAKTLVSWWRAGVTPHARAVDVARALARVRAKDAVGPLARSLDDVRLRPTVAESLAAIGDRAAIGPLAAAFASERYVPARQALARALGALGATRELAAPLARYLGTPDALADGLAIALDARVLGHVGGPTAPALAALRAGAREGVALRVAVPPGGNGGGARVLVALRTSGGRDGALHVGAPARSTSLRGFDGVERGVAPDPARALRFAPPAGAGDRVVQLVATAPSDLGARAGGALTLAVRADEGVEFVALAVVPLADEVPPPPPEPWTPETSPREADDDAP